MTAGLPLPAYFLVGPTGCGKTALSLPVAEALGAEIVAMDSMQVYAGMPVATAQPEPEELARVPHHLFARVGLGETYDTARYLGDAVEAARGILGRGRRVLFVGGSGLYYRSLTRGLANLPSRDPGVRASIAAELAAPEGAERLRAELAAVDPESASRIGPRDYHRLERAVEVFRLTGRPMGERWEEPATASFTAIAGVVLRPPRAWLHARLATRIEAMVRRGLVEELRALVDRREQGLRPTALQALGVRAFADHLAGSEDLGKAEEKLLIEHRRLVRKQETWFRSFPELGVVDPSQPGAAEAVHRVLGAGGPAS